VLLHTVISNDSLDICYVCMQVLRELLDVGAPVDLTCEAGWTPLHRACLNGHAAVAHELVVARKANMLAATKDGRTAILLAAQGQARHEYDCAQRGRGRPVCRQYTELGSRWQEQSALQDWQRHITMGLAAKLPATESFLCAYDNSS
jgi:hypothetical protein